MSEYLNLDGMLLATIYDALHSSPRYLDGIRRDRLFEIFYTGLDEKDPVTSTLRTLYRTGLVLPKERLDVELQLGLRRLEERGLLLIQRDGKDYDESLCTLTEKGERDGQRLSSFVTLAEYVKSDLPGFIELG